MNIVILISITLLRKEQWGRGLLSSLESLGHTVSVLRSNLVTTQELTNYDLIISFGQHEVAPKEVPCMVLDLGYFDRYTAVNNTGYLQICPNSLNNIAPTTVDSTRNKSTVQSKPTTDDMPYLVLGQREGDKQHGMTQGQLRAYYNKTIAAIHAEDPTREVWFRNHPQSAFKFDLKGITKVVDDGPLAALVGQVSCVYTFNSTGALCFLLGLTKVIADESAFFHAVGLSPTKENINKLCDRLWYSQWNAAELTDTKTVNTLIDYVLTGKLGSTPTKTKRKAPKISDETPILTPIDPNSSSSFHMDTAAAIMEEKDFRLKQAMFKQVWPDIRAVSKKAIHAHCNKIINNPEH